MADVHMNYGFPNDVDKELTRLQKIMKETTRTGILNRIVMNYDSLAQELYKTGKAYEATVKRHATRIAQLEKKCNRMEGATKKLIKTAELNLKALKKAARQ